MRIFSVLSALALAVAAACGAGTRASDTGVRVRCGVDLGIGPAEGTRTDWGAAAQAWTASVRGDTLTLSRRGRCGDECSYTEEITLTGLDLPCPRFHAAQRIRSESGSPAGRTRAVVQATKGTLDIQDWSGPAGVISGRLSAEFGLTFHARLDSLEKE